MEINIDIKDYLSYDEIKGIATDTVWSIFLQQIKSEVSFDNFLSNVGYQVFMTKVCEVMNTNIEEIEGKILNKVQSLINEDRSYLTHIFRRKGRYSENEDGPDTKILDQALTQAKPLIERKVNELIEKYPFREVREDICHTIYDCIEKRLFGSKEE